MADRISRRALAALALAACLYLVTAVIVAALTT